MQKQQKQKIWKMKCHDTVYICDLCRRECKTIYTKDGNEYLCKTCLSKNIPMIRICLY